MPTLADTIATLRARVSDREIALGVARAEQNGQEGRLLDEITMLNGQITALKALETTPTFTPPAPEEEAPVDEETDEDEGKPKASRK